MSYLTKYKYKRPEPINMEDYTQTRKGRFVANHQLDDWKSPLVSARRADDFDTFVASDVAELRPGEFYYKTDVLAMVVHDKLPRGAVLDVEMLPYKVTNEDILPCFKFGLEVASTGSLGIGRSWGRDLMLVHHYGACHFPVVVRMPGVQNMRRKGKIWYLHNGDRWPGGGGWGSPISHYQTQARRLFPDQPLVSLDLLRTANIDYQYIYYVDSWPDTQQRAELFNPHSTCHCEEFYMENNTVLSKIEFDRWIQERSTRGTLSLEKDGEGKVVRASWHLLGSLLFMYQGKYYLASMDEERYFLSQLPHKCARVATAFEMLKPRRVREAIKQGKDVKRQGEWFFIPVDEMPLRLRERDWVPRYALPQKDSRSDNKHMATRGVTVGGKRYVKGLVRHINEITDRHSGEHKIMRFYKDIHMAVCNTSLADWSTTGRGID